MKIDDIENWLSEQSVSHSRLDDSDLAGILSSWDKTFSAEVKRQTGKWIHLRFRWHTFSYEFYHADEGEAAIQKYLNQWRARFVVFDETGKWCLSCLADSYPDFTPLRDDLYVSHHNMKWTMAFTHEQPDIGPFFASPT